MRTMVTLDPDVEAMLRPLEPLTFDMGRPSADLAKPASLAVELEDDEILGRYRRSR